MLFPAEKILYMIIMNDLFLKLVGTCFTGFCHFNAFGKQFARSCLECCNNLLCHIISLLLYFLMNCMSLQDGIIFLPLKPVRGILPVLCSNIPGSPWFAALLVFRTLQNNLQSVPFSLLCHCALILIIQDVTFFLSFLKNRNKSVLANQSYTGG